MTFSPQEIHQLQQQLQQQQQNLQNLQQMLLLQSGQLNPANIQAMLLQNQGALLRQGLLQQSLQNFTSPGLTIPQVAAAAQQLSHLQDTQQILQQKGISLPQDDIHRETRETSSTGLLRNKESNRSSSRHHQQQGNPVVWTPSNNTQKDRLDENHQTTFEPRGNISRESSSPVNAFSFARKELDSIENQTSKNGHSNGTTNELKIQIPLRSRAEPSPEEMTDLEELEQFAKMFKQRRIKLGK